jgi:PAS domain S-box-containing protein
MVWLIHRSDAPDPLFQLATSTAIAASRPSFQADATTPSAAVGLAFHEQARSAEQALRASELKFREFIEIVPSMLWSAAPSGEPTHVNQRVLDYAGLCFEDFLNLGWEKFLHPEDFPETAGAFYQAIQTGEPYEAVHRLRRADGQYRWHHARGEPLRDKDQRIIQWFGLSVDIDDSKKAESELRSAQAKLARVSQAVTAARLSASIANEIDAPLAEIIASAEACRTWLSGDNPDAERVRTALEHIIRNGGTAADVIHRIRALIQQTAPAMSLLQINEVAHEVRRLDQRELDRNGIASKSHPEQAFVGRLRFGPFEFSSRDRVLQCEGSLIPLGSRALDILAYLALRAGEVISKKQLIDHVWPDVNVEEGSLRVHVAAIRKALRDGQLGHRYIANVRGRGYSFVGAVVRLEDSNDGGQQ